MPKGDGRGGKREGRGRKPKYKSNSPRKNFWLPMEYGRLVERYVKELDEKRYGDDEEEPEEELECDEVPFG